MKKHLANGIKVYDPFVKKDIVENQYHDLYEFLNGIDIVVIMVAHDDLINNAKIFKNKVILDTRNTLIFKDFSYKL